MTATEPSTCRTCSAEFVPMVLSVLGQEIFRQLYCPACVEADARAEEAKHKAARTVDEAREDAWAGICDAEYRLTHERAGNTVLQRLQRDCPKLAEVLAWDDRSKGLVLVGDTGKGKTRSMWRLMRRMYDEGKRIQAMTGGDFARQFADSCGNFTRTDWFGGLVAADILFMDDLGKSEWTANVWGEFFEMIEARGKKGRPVLITTNETGETLSRKAKDQTTFAPLYRRLKEYPQIKL